MSQLLYNLKLGSTSCYTLPVKIMMKKKLIQVPKIEFPFEGIEFKFDQK
jgi:hypothetical protein